MLSPFRRLARVAIPILATSTLAVPSCGQTESWLDYRGPDRNGFLPDADVPLEWSEQKNVAWKTAIRGEGWSSPLVHEGRIWLTTATEKGRNLHVVAVSFQNGEVLHDRIVFTNERPEPKNKLNSYASPSPAVEDGRVYVHFGTYGTACLDASSGETLWERRDIHCDHMEGPGSSPVIVDDALVFHMDGGDVQYVIALDKRTGETRWRTPRSTDFNGVQPDLRKAYSTPIVVPVDGQEWLISSGARCTMAYDPETGAELWRVRHPGFSMASRPLTDGETVYLTTGFMRGELHAVRLGGEGDVTDTAPIWQWQRNVPRMPSPILADGRIYMVDDGGRGTCLDAATGKPIWRQRIGGEHSASPIAIGDRIYFFDREGRTVVLARGDEFEKLGTNRLNSGFMASPAVVGNAFVLRTKTHLYRIQADA